MDPTKPMYVVCAPDWAVNQAAYAGIFAVLCLIGSLIVVIYAWNHRNAKLFYMLTFLWAFVPPFAFWCEYFLIYRNYGAKDTFALYTYGQQVSGAMWAAVVAALLVMGNSDRFKHAID